MSSHVFSGVLGHTTVVSVLERHLAHPAGGYLFLGPHGVGKRFLAEKFIRGILGIEETHPLTSHPDFVQLVLAEEKKSIGVEQARAFRERVSMRPVKGMRQIAFVPFAGMLTGEACEALLKCVEEPTPGTVFIFIAESADMLPATLRSRLVEVSFGHVATAEIVSWLVSKGVEQSLAQTLARKAHGAPGHAWKTVLDPHAHDEDEQDAQEVVTSCLRHEHGRLIAVLDRTEKRLNAEEDAIEAWGRWLSRLEFAVADELLTHPEVLARLGRGIAMARASVGGGISPKYAIEWSMVDVAGIIRTELIPSFLYPPYV